MKVYGTTYGAPKPFARKHISGEMALMMCFGTCSTISFLLHTAYTQHPLLIALSSRPFNYSESKINSHCERKYGVKPQYFAIANEFGAGLESVRNASNIVFSNGRFDPWRAGGVTTFNNTIKSIWSIIIPNGAHHVDLMFKTEQDTPDLKIARDFEVERIKEWTQ